jgi:hypothetical protein
MTSSGKKGKPPISSRQCFGSASFNGSSLKFYGGSGSRVPIKHRSMQIRIQASLEQVLVLRNMNILYRHIFIFLQYKGRLDAFLMEKHGKIWKFL